MKKIIPAIFAIALVFQMPLYAGYLENIPQTFKQPDGQILHCFTTGDEYYSWLHDAANYTIIQNHLNGYYVYAAKSGSQLVPTPFIAGRADPAAAGLQPGVNLEPEEIARLAKKMCQIPELKGLKESNNIGNFNNIAIFIRFSDQDEYACFEDTYDSIFNATTNVSMSGYYKEVSFSQLSVRTSVFPISNDDAMVSYQDSHPRNYYLVYDATTNPIGYKEMERSDRERILLVNAIQAVKSQIESTGIDYDLDNNGMIDNICFVVQGTVGGRSNLLWPHMSVLYSCNIQLAGLRVNKYNFQFSESLSPSSLCHEMSHTLGFPDLYHYLAVSPVAPIGPWDVMATRTSPPQHHGVYTKQKYGRWCKPLSVISTPGTYTLLPISTDPFAGYKILSPNSSTEFFVVEYRRATGAYESLLKGSGLIISRINTLAYGNSGGPPDEVYIYRPDGTTTVQGFLYSAHFSAGTGRTSFTSTSNPACFLSDGSPGGIEITNIGEAGESISFTVSFPSDIDQSKAESGFQVYPNPANDQVTVKVTDAHGYEHQLEVLNILGRLEMIQTLTQESTVIDMSKMAKGVYFFRVTSKNQTPGMKKVIRD